MYTRSWLPGPDLKIEADTWYQLLYSEQVQAVYSQHTKQPSPCAVSNLFPCTL